MKVMFYSHSSDVSGAEISLLLTIQGLSHTETVLVAPEGELLQRARDTGISVTALRSHRARMSRNPFALLIGLIGTLLAGLRLRRLVHHSQPDVVHANSIRAGLIATVATLGLPTRLVWHVRDNLPMNLVGRSIRALAQRHADLLFVISNKIFEDFAVSEGLQRKSRVVHNGIDHRTVGVPQNLRSAHGASQSTFIVGVVGQITPWKRQEDAITAVASVVRRDLDCELWIVGSPKFRKENIAYEQQLREQAEELGIANRVRFLGFQRDVMSVMHSIDVLLVPSENEPFGRVVIEAMLMGKPVIGTNGGGIPEIIDDARTGLLVDTGDTRTMSHLLEWLQRNPELCAYLGNHGRERAVTEFSIERTCSKIEEAYLALLTPGDNFQAASARVHPESRAADSRDR